MKNIPAFRFRHFFSVLALLLWANAGFAQKNATLRSDHQARFEAMVQADTAVLTAYLDPRLRYIHSNGLVENLKTHVQTVSSRKIVYERFEEAIEPEWFVWGKTALVQGRVGVGGLYEGTPFQVSLWYTAVYRKKAGKWRLVSWQSTKAT